MAIARFPSIVIDCPDPDALASFYGTMLDWKVEPGSDWVDIRADYGQCISFQKVDDFTPPTWPSQEAPQQMHLDVVVDDLDAAEAAVLDYRAPEWPGQEHPQQLHVDVVVDDLDVAEAAVLELGAAKHEHQPGTTFRVLLDPAGHPFCLCLS
jgi:glyoxalase superfamily protein